MTASSKAPDADSCAEVAMASHELSDAQDIPQALQDEHQARVKSGTLAPRDKQAKSAKTE